MKVRISEIPEKDGKPQYPDRATKTLSGNFEFDDDKDDDEDDEKDEEEEVRYSKSMIHLEDFGIAMSLFGIESIEKDIKFVDKPKAHWEYGIIINKGMEMSMRFPRTDVAVWFFKEEVRDKRWDNIIEILKQNGTNVIDI